jgi:hypothetical protein
MKLYFKKVIAFALILVSSLSGVASAQSTLPSTDELTAESILPADIDILYELNTNEKDPFDQYPEVFSTMVQGFMQEFTTDPEVVELARKVFVKNKVTFALEFAEDLNLKPDLFLMFNISGENFDMLMKSGDQPKTEVYNQMTIYNFDDQSSTYKDQTSVALLKNLLIASNSNEALKKILDDYNKGTTETLANNPNYTTTKSYDLAGNFLRMYIDPSYAKNALEGNTGEFSPFFSNVEIWKSMAESLLAESVSIVQDANGFLFSFAVKGDKDKLSQLGLSFDQYNFVPTLYKKISGKDLMLYSEGFNVQKQLQNVGKMFGTEPFEELNSWKAEVKNTSGIDLDADLLALFNSNYALAIHKTDQIYPAVTLFADVKANMGKAEETLLKLDKYLKTTFEQAEKESGKEFFKAIPFSVAGAKVAYQYQFDMVKLMGDGVPSSVLTPEKTVLTLQFVLRDDGLLFVSNHPHLADLLKGAEGLLENLKFREAFKDADETLSSLFFVDAQPMHDYAIDAIDFSQEIERSLDPNVDRPGVYAESRKSVDDFFAPWNYLFLKSYGQSDLSWANGVLRVDVTKFASYQEFFKDLLSQLSMQSSEASVPEDFGDSQIVEGFCDVPTDNWAYPFIASLSDRGIIQGYPDGCFRPLNQITRAEFSQILAKALESHSNYLWPSHCKIAGFSDVPSSFWGAESIAKLACAGYVEGYQDGLFKPNNVITRAEAVQILRKIAVFREMDTSISADFSFQDVRKGDWFYDAVGYSFKNEIISGVSETAFEPHRNLTRAEGAKIIKLFLDLFLYGSNQTVPQTDLRPIPQEGEEIF